MQAIILCGGLSTRLGEITKTLPKILLEIKGKTVLDWQLLKLKEAGVTEAVLAAGHLWETLKELAGSERQGIKLKYAVEQERLGTGGAIKFAWSYLSKSDEPVMILNGDILSAVSINKMAEQLRPGSEGIILGAQVPDASTYGTLIFEADKKLLEFREKEGLVQPGYINGGFYLFTTEALKHFPEENKFSIEYDVFPKMKNLDVYPSDLPWIDIGVPERLEWAKNNWQGDDSTYEMAN